MVVGFVTVGHIAYSKHLNILSFQVVLIGFVLAEYSGGGWRLGTGLRAAAKTESMPLHLFSAFLFGEPFLPPVIAFAPHSSPGG